MKDIKAWAVKDNKGGIYQVDLNWKKADALYYSDYYGQGGVVRVRITEWKEGEK